MSKPCCILSKYDAYYIVNERWLPQVFNNELNSQFEILNKIETGGPQLYPTSSSKTFKRYIFSLGL